MTYNEMSIEHYYKLLSVLNSLQPKDDDCYVLVSPNTTIAMNVKVYPDGGYLMTPYSQRNAASVFNVDDAQHFSKLARNVVPIKYNDWLSTAKSVTQNTINKLEQMEQTNGTE